MNVIDWTNEMSVGRADLDEHHRMIIDCLNRLQPLIGASGHDDEIRAVLDTLEDFVLVHFSEEERAMKAAGYPDWRPHKDQHDAMYNLVFKLKANIEHGRIPDAEPVFHLLYEWLIKHILGEDRRYMPYLENPVPVPEPVWHRSNGRPF